MKGMVEMAWLRRFFNSWKMGLSARLTSLRITRTSGWRMMVPLLSTRKAVLRDIETRWMVLYTLLMLKTTVMTPCTLLFTSRVRPMTNTIWLKSSE